MTKHQIYEPMGANPIQTNARLNDMTKTIQDLKIKINKGLEVMKETQA